MKRYLFLYFAIVLPICIYAGPVDVETARQQAMDFWGSADFLKHHRSSNSKRMISAKKPMRLLHTQRQSDGEVPTLYVFGNEGDEGFVVIAGDDLAKKPVLGYSSKG